MGLQLVRYSTVFTRLITLPLLCHVGQVQHILSLSLFVENSCLWICGELVLTLNKCDTTSDT